LRPVGALVSRSCSCHPNRESGLTHTGTPRTAARRGWTDRSSERPSAPSDCTRSGVLAAPVCGSKLLPAGAMHGETDVGDGGAPVASARGRSSEVVLLTPQCPVVELPAHDQKAAAQQKAIGVLDAGKRRALGPMLTAERVRCKRPKLSKADIEAALWLRGVQPARKSGGSLRRRHRGRARGAAAGPLWGGRRGARKRWCRRGAAAGGRGGRLSVRFRHGALCALRVCGSCRIVYAVLTDGHIRAFHRTMQRILKDVHFGALYVSGSKSWLHRWSSASRKHDEQCFGLTVNDKCQRARDLCA